MARISVVDIPKIIGTNKFTKPYEIIRIKKNLKNLPINKAKGASFVGTTGHAKSWVWSAGVDIAYGLSPCIHGKIMEEITLEKVGAVRFDEYVKFKTWFGLEIIGKLDGVLKDDNGKVKTIVEVKNRVHKFGNYQHDIDQILLYLYLYCRMNDVYNVNAHLVQQLDDEIEITIYKYIDACDRFGVIQKLLKKELYDKDLI